MKKSITIIVLIIVLGCRNEHAQTNSPKRLFSSKVVEISAPPGYTIDSFEVNSFPWFVQHLALKSNNVILDYNGDNVFNPIYRVKAVLDLPLLYNRDLEQCADFAMRIRAEFYKTGNSLDSLYLFNYSGKKIYMSDSSQSYTKFLRNVFVNANSYSLKKGCKQIVESQIQPGDLIVQNEDGGVGHVSMVVNSCTSKAGERLFLIGFSFMPAQEFHIEDAMNYGKGGWFSISGYREFLKNHLDLGEPVLRRF